MALTIGPLLALPLAGLLIRRAGFRYDAWVFPAALGFHWLLIRGHGTEPLYLLAVTLFVLAAGGAAFAGVNAPRARRATRRRSTLRAVREVETVAEPERTATPAPTPAPAVAPAEEPAVEPAPPVASDPTVRPEPVPEANLPAEPEPEPEPVITPPANERELLERIDGGASDAQRVHLLGKLRAEGESVAYLRANADAPQAILAHAWTTVAHAWGDQRRDGFLVRFDGAAPKGSTILLVLCEVNDPAGLLDASTRDELCGSALLVPSDLEGVKRLGDVGSGDARWVARAVFVPLHLLVGEATEGGRGRGHGETITGPPA